MNSHSEVVEIEAKDIEPGMTIQLDSGHSFVIDRVHVYPPDLPEFGGDVLLYPVNTKNKYLDLKYNQKVKQLL